ncbi:hypothetical protein [Pseudonocardia nantongensis]|uniref:hypothetical protein n=1 Tax=Pseudonocardia nantongensis TaxID=1181885 RepID=UPI00397C93AE
MPWRPSGRRGGAEQQHGSSSRVQALDRPRREPVEREQGNNRHDATEHSAGRDVVRAAVGGIDVPTAFDAVDAVVVLA